MDRARIIPDVYGHNPGRRNSRLLHQPALTSIFFVSFFAFAVFGRGTVSGSVQNLSHFRLAERHPALAHAMVAPLICWSFSEAWRNRPIEGEHPYVYLDGIVLKRSWAGSARSRILSPNFTSGGIAALSG